MDKIQKKLEALFIQKFKEDVIEFETLPASGSGRTYYRLRSENKQVIGAYSEDRRENEAFIYFSNYFYDKSLPVPEIFAENLQENIYLQEDLGDQSLYHLIERDKVEGFFSEKLKTLYKTVLEKLVSFQLANNFEGSYCYPRDKFDKQSIQWDLNYFKYYFLKLAYIPFDEQYIENDFQKLITYISEIDSNYFMYRDFQSRNILLKNNEPYFIDYQGGRRGPLQYDVASLLFQVKADIPFDIRSELLNFYIDCLNERVEVDRNQFKKHYYAMVLVRLLQVMGAYGYRGFFERKQHWLTSIPYAQRNIEWLLNNIEFDIELPYLFQALNLITTKEILTMEKSKLKVQINSFSYKRGIPVELAGNGGGHVFDCRALPNPGRQEEYKKLTGMDRAVVDYLENQEETSLFRKSSFFLVEQSIKNYMERGFSDLMVNFGCTGGQHRSVYFAQQLADYLKNKYDINIELRHREQEK